MNTYDIYLQGGQVITVESVVEYKDFFTKVFSGDERQEWIYFSKPRKMGIKKDSIIGVMDMSKQKMPYSGYKPWAEEK
ncbi:hypothetical protein CPT_Silence67 [Bacillus phage Silence]|nr:hypothetical protein CPT_Silence67 [Bacillus phage Silence]